MFALTQTCRNDFREMFLAAVAIQRVRRGYMQRMGFAERHPELYARFGDLKGHMFRTGSVLATRANVTNAESIHEIDIDITGDGHINATIGRTTSAIGEETWGADTTGDGKHDTEVIAIDAAGDGKIDTLVLDTTGDGQIDTAIAIHDIDDKIDAGKAGDEVQEEV